MRYFAVTFALIASLSLSIFAQRQAEDFTAADMGGQAVALSSLKGKVVVMTFWTTHCPICHSEIPKLNRMAAGYAGANVVFLAPTTEDESKVTAYLRNNPFSATILPNSFGLLLKYAQRDAQGNLDMGYPSYFLIDQQGRIEYRANGWDKIKQLDSGIARLLAR